MRGKAGARSRASRAETKGHARLRVTSSSRPPSDYERQQYEDLIRRLTARRDALDISQAELDERLGVSSGQVAKWETFARLPGAFMMACWCAALRVTLVPVEE